MTKVLLYSGGLDSMCARFLWNPDVLLYINMGTKYTDAEQSRLPTTVQTETLDLSPWERSDGIIPNRNLILCAIATNYGNHIALAATAGDRVLDKSTEFAEQASTLLSYLWQPQHWTSGKDIKIELPVKHLSKLQLVQQALQAGATPLELGSSWSCYTPVNNTECGACKPCCRKWVALAAAGYPDVTVDASKAVKTHYLPAIKNGTWDRGKAEADAVLQALKTV